MALILALFIVRIIRKYRRDNSLCGHVKIFEIGSEREEVYVPGDPLRASGYDCDSQYEQ